MWGTMKIQKIEHDLCLHFLGRRQYENPQGLVNTTDPLRQPQSNGPSKGKAVGGDLWATPTWPFTVT